MPAELDPHILAQMTEEERSAIEEKQTPEEIAAIAAIANGSEDDDDEDEDEEDDAGAATAAAKTDPDPTAAPAKSDAAPAATEAVADNSFTPTYQSKLPDDFEAQVTAIKDQSDALAAKFKGGEMDFDQYRIEAEALAKSERALDAVALKASLSQEMSAQTAEQQWNHTVSRFMSVAAKAEVGAIDYRTDAAKNKDLDLFVKSLAQDTANSDKPAEWFLTEAHKRVLALHGIGLVQAPANTDPKATRKPNLSSVPKTLAQVPGGDGPGDVDGNEFSDIDRLKGDDLEAAIAKMTPAQRDRYMASA
jgi:hypothetical protein